MANPSGSPSAVDDVSQPGRAAVDKTSAKKPEKARESLHKALPMNSIPPKRSTPKTETKRNATTPDASRSTVSSASRHKPKGSITKPPINSPSKPDSGRSQSAASSIGAATVGHKASKSVSSFNGATSQKKGLGSGRDDDKGNKSPTLAEKTGSKTPIKSIARSLSNWSSPAPQTTTGKRPHSTLTRSSRAIVQPEAWEQDAKGLLHKELSVDRAMLAKPASKMSTAKKPSKGSISSKAQAKSDTSEVTVSLNDASQPHETTLQQTCQQSSMQDMKHQQGSQLQDDSELSNDTSTEILQKTLQSQLDQVRLTLASVHASNIELRHQLNEQEQRDKEAIEALQDRICHLSETKEREIEAVKQVLAKEHEGVVASLRMELENVVRNDQQPNDSGASDDSSTEVLQKTYQSQVDQLRTTLASVHTCNIELRRELEEQKQRHNNELSASKMELTHSLAESDELRVEMARLRQQWTDSESKKNIAHSTLESKEQALKDSSDNIANLQEQLATLNNEVTVLSEKNVGAELELAAEKKLLDKLREENQRLSAGHESEYERLRELRAELEYRAFKAEEACDDLTLERVTSNSRIESLRTELSEAKSAPAQEADQELAMLRAEVQAATQAKEELAIMFEEAKESHKMHVRELESALKVTTAELVELRTNRPNGSSYSGSPIPKSGFRSSRWARVDGNGSGEGGDALVGEDLSSHVQGQV